MKYANTSQAFKKASILMNAFLSNYSVTIRVGKYNGGKIDFDQFKRFVHILNNTIQILSDPIIDMAIQTF